MYWSRSPQRVKSSSLHKPEIWSCRSTKRRQGLPAELLRQRHRRDMHVRCVYILQARHWSRQCEALSLVPTAMPNGQRFIVNGFVSEQRLADRARRSLSLGQDWNRSIGHRDMEHLTTRWLLGKQGIGHSSMRRVDDKKVIDSWASYAQAES